MDIIYTKEQLQEALKIEREKTILTYGLILFLIGIALSSCVWVSVIYNQKLTHQKELLYVQEKALEDFRDTVKTKKEYLKYLKNRGI
jgi:hypothetical protein